MQRISRVIIIALGKKWFLLVAQTYRNARVQLEIKLRDRLIKFMNITKNVSLFFMQIFYSTANCRAVRQLVFGYCCSRGLLWENNCSSLFHKCGF